MSEPTATIITASFTALSAACVLFCAWLEYGGRKRCRVDAAFQRGVREGRRMAEAEGLAAPTDWHVTDTGTCSPGTGARG